MRPLLLVLLLGPSALLCAQQRKVLIIGIDGCRGDAILASNAPNLQGLAASGFSTFEANTHPPTWSATGWSTMLTGVWEQKHKVVENTFAGQQYAVWPHFFARLHQADPLLATHSIVHWAPINTQITTSATQELNLASDQLVADSAVALLQNRDPDVLFLQFDDVDHAGHLNGFSPSVPAYIAAIELVDTRIGPILAAIDARPANEEWMILVTTDHGGNLSGHGGITFDEQRIFTIAAGPGISVEARTADRDTLIAASSIAFGTSDHVRVNDATPYQFGDAQDFTIECNVKMPLTWSGDPVFVGNKDWNSGSNPGFVLSTTSTGYNWKFNIGDGVDRVDLSGLPINDGQWHHIAVTCDRDGEARIFQDGLLLRAADMTAIGDVSTALELCFGQDGTTTYGSDLAGTLHDVRMWNKTLDINTISAWSGKTIVASHPDIAFLIGEWPMDEGSDGALMNAVSSAPDAQHYAGANTSNASWTANTDPLITTDLTATPTQADLVPTILSYLCITNDPNWQLDGQSLVAECISTSIGERMPSTSSIFPNPGTDHFTLSLPPGAHIITLFDALGRKVMSTRTADSVVRIGSGHLLPGAYAVWISDAQGAVTKGMWVKD